MQNPVYKFVLLWPLAIFHVQQSLRLYPPAGQTFRQVSKENYEIAGYPVPKGTDVGVRILISLCIAEIAE